MKQDTIVDIRKLFDYLDGFTFVDNEEIEMAICDFIEKQEWSLYWSDCAFASELCNEYREYLDNSF